MIDPASNSVQKNAKVNVVASSAGLPAPVQRFSDVLIAVEQATHLALGTRRNLRSAVTRTADLVSAQGLRGPVNIQRLQAEFERLTPAMLNLSSDNGLAAFKSNLRRALRLAGHDVMPGRHVTSLSPAWACLMAKFGTDRMAIKLSRFAHVASTQGWEPDDISPTHLERFHNILKLTNLGAKTRNVLRGTITAWDHGRCHFEGWPNIDLGQAPAETRFYGLSWSAFPASFREDVEHFLSRPGSNLQGIFGTVAKGGELPSPAPPKSRSSKPLHIRTQENYREALRRSASILVHVGRREAEQITGLAALIGVDEAREILHFLAQRTGRQDGGCLALVALMLFLAARDYVLPSEETVIQLGLLWRLVRGPHREMSPRSLRRLCQFDDDDKAKKMARLPSQLASAARGQGNFGPKAIKLMRTAVFVAIALDTGLRSGNIINLELDRHIAFKTCNKQRIAWITNPGEEVKNGKTLVSELTRETTRLIDLWLSNYRDHACPPDKLNAPYLFPIQGGGHMSGPHASANLKVLAAQYAGLDITPHGIRAYLGKLVLDENPDGHVVVQALLGHSSLQTTLGYYTPIRPHEAKRRAQKLLLAKRKDLTDER